MRVAPAGSWGPTRDRSSVRGWVAIGATWERARRPHPAGRQVTEAGTREALVDDSTEEQGIVRARVA